MSVTADSLPPSSQSIAHKISNKASKSAWSIPLNHEIKQEKEPRELVQLVAQVRLMIHSTSELIGTL